MGRGILEFFLRKKSWPSHFLEWINLHDPLEIPKQKHLAPPPPPHSLPIEDKNDLK